MRYLPDSNRFSEARAHVLVTSSPSSSYVDMTPRNVSNFGLGFSHSM